MTSVTSISDNLRAELSHISGAHIAHDVHIAKLRSADSQYPMEARYTVEDWELQDGKWKYLAVYDGHGSGCEAAEFVADNLPRMLKKSLEALIRVASDKNLNTPAGEEIRRILTETIHDIDERIKNDFLGLFGDISTLSDAEIAASIADSDPERSRIEVLRARTGTTAVVALIHPTRTMHVARVGDSQFVMGFRDRSLACSTANHNANSKQEADRIRADHPGEADCIVGGRTLGLTSSTRALGDMMFKLPAIYTERVFAVSKPLLHEGFPVHALIARNITPPYLSNEAQISHLGFSVLKEPFLILYSEGLADLCSKTPNLNLERGMQRFFANAVTDVLRQGDHLAVEVLWAALGGNDKAATGSMEITSAGRVDDATVLVLRL
ncbi:phosphatase 2C-like domain-containing protein [Mycena floridula]|nr:phosphatase 2C-like domain-containing protein [Mycena floridula]